MSSSIKISIYKVSGCAGCDDKVTNDGSNVHVCFPCHRDKAVAPSHLCSRHHAAPWSASRTVIDFMDPPKDKVEETDTSCGEPV